MKTAEPTFAQKFPDIAITEAAKALIKSQREALDALEHQINELQVMLNKARAGIPWHPQWEAS